MSKRKSIIRRVSLATNHRARWRQPDAKNSVGIIRMPVKFVIPTRERSETGGIRCSAAEINVAAEESLSILRFLPNHLSFYYETFSTHPELY